MHHAAIFAHAGVKRDDLDAAVHSTLEHRGQRVGVIGGDHDGRNLLRDQRVDDFDLAFGRGLGRAGVDDLNVFEFLGGFLRALVGGVKEAVAQTLHHQSDFVGRKRGADQCRAQGDGQQGFELFLHALSPGIVSRKIDPKAGLDTDCTHQGLVV